jgi:hypothetical protein
MHFVTISRSEQKTFSFKDIKKNKMLLLDVLHFCRHQHHCRLFSLALLLLITCENNNKANAQMYSPLPKFKTPKSTSMLSQLSKQMLESRKLIDKQKMNKLAERKKELLEQQRREKEYRDTLNRVLNSRQNDKSVFNDFYSGRY